jgi:hypothetical protein
VDVVPDVDGEPVEIAKRHADVPARVVHEDIEPTELADDGLDGRL